MWHIALLFSAFVELSCPQEGTTPVLSLQSCFLGAHEKCGLESFVLLCVLGQAAYLLCLCPRDFELGFASGLLLWAFHGSLLAFCVLCWRYSILEIQGARAHVCA